MPEGPEVYTVRDYLSQFTSHAVTVDLKLEIVDGVLLHVACKGKKLAMIFAHTTVQFSFGLNGGFTTQDKNNSLAVLRCKDTVLHFSSFLGNVKQLSLQDLIAEWGKLGPSPILTEDGMFPPIAHVLNNTPPTKFPKSKRNVTAILLDQKIISGVGNVIRNEVLWICRIHPHSIWNNIPDTLKALLFQTVWEVCNKLYTCPESIFVYGKTTTPTNHPITDIPKDVVCNRRRTYFSETEQVKY